MIISTKEVGVDYICFGLLGCLVLLKLTMNKLIAAVLPRRVLLISYAAAAGFQAFWFTSLKMPVSASNLQCAG